MEGISVTPSIYLIDPSLRAIFWILKTRLKFEGGVIFFKTNLLAHLGPAGLSIAEGFCHLFHNYNNNKINPLRQKVSLKVEPFLPKSTLVANGKILILVFKFSVIHFL